MNKILQSLSVDPASDHPLALQLKQQLTWLIATHQLNPGDNLPPVRKLGEHLGINLNTVRAAYQKLEADSLVTTRHGVGTTVLPFNPRQYARRAPQVRTYTIGVLIAGLISFYLPFLQGIEEIAQQDPSLVFINNTGDSLLKAKIAIDQLVAKQVDGLIVASVGHIIEREIGVKSTEPLSGLPPVVYVDQPDLSGHLILPDGEGGGYQATHHLIEHGYEQIGLVSPPIEMPNVAAVFRGYQRALAEARLNEDLSKTVIVPSFNMTDGFRAGEQLLDLKSPPRAIFVAGGDLAIGVLQAVKSRRLSVPDDIAITGYADVEIAALVEPPLTMVSLHNRELGIEAMKLLQRLIAGNCIEPQITTLATQLVIRQSCGCER